MTSSSPNKQVLLSLINFLAQTPSREKVTIPISRSVDCSSISPSILPPAMSNWISFSPFDEMNSKVKSKKHNPCQAVCLLLEKS